MAPTDTGRTMLSKSLIGAASISMAATAIAKDRGASPETARRPRSGRRSGRSGCPRGTSRP